MIWVKRHFTLRSRLSETKRISPQVKLPPTWGRGTTQRKPMDDFLQVEVNFLKPLPAVAYQVEEFAESHVRKDGHIRFKNKYYSLCLAVQPKVMARALAIAHSAISNYYRKKEGLPKTESMAGAVTLIQRFGGSLNLNVHFHQLTSTAHACKIAWR